ncbi:MAG TPA: Dam family site-specific DNA-(adenine-N6)-methyltransferase [Anaerolineales bacterium]|nr:Dam family site-specific DNA-(adenine-N6)-methyltransferase [Anaerolineales bacterium]
MKTIQDTSQLYLFEAELHKARHVEPFNTSLLKWIGSKQRMAHQIISYFPINYGTYYEPFLGSGGILGTLVPNAALASDTFSPLIQIWQTLKNSPETLKEWYQERWKRMSEDKKVDVYEEIKASYNKKPNGADLLFLTRSCYGGVVRFRKADGYMSTPCGIHNPISPQSFARRVDEWHKRILRTNFLQLDFEEAMNLAKAGDLIYCDPPYSYSQAILYGAQSFSLERLLEVIARCKAKGVFVALSIDGTKRSGNTICDLPIPNGLFEYEIMIDIGHSMLKRFQMNGKKLDGEKVSDRLLLTYQNIF